MKKKDIIKYLKDSYKTSIRIMRSNETEKDIRTRYAIARSQLFAMYEIGIINNDKYDEMKFDLHEEMEKTIFRIKKILNANQKKESEQNDRSENNRSENNRNI